MPSASHGYMSACFYCNYTTVYRPRELASLHRPLERSLIEWTEQSRGTLKVSHAINDRSCIEDQRGHVLLAVTCYWLVRKRFVTICFIVSLCDVVARFRRFEYESYCCYFEACAVWLIWRYFRHSTVRPSRWLYGHWCLYVNSFI